MFLDKPGKPGGSGAILPGLDRERDLGSSFVLGNGLGFLARRPGQPWCLPEMCRSWDRELISGRSSFSFPISFRTKNVSGNPKDRDDRVGDFVRSVVRSLNRNLLNKAAK